MSTNLNSTTSATQKASWKSRILHFLKDLLAPVEKTGDLLIAQVTDMHIGISDAPYRNIPVRQQFLDVLQVLAQRPIDLLVISGDLAAVAGEPEAYAWLKQSLATFPHPYVVMVGNHDHLERLNQAFELPVEDVKNGMLYFSRTLKGRHLFFLDSSSYRLPLAQMDWLRAQLARVTEEVLLFIHHPPLLCECRFMDERYALQNISEVWPTLVHLPQVKHIFCGHYHTEKTVTKEGKTVYLTPSTIFQIDTQSPYFVMASTQPGWRIIEWKGTQVHTYVEYL